MLTLGLTILIVSAISNCNCEIKLADDYLDVQYRPDGPAEVFALALNKLDLKSASTQADILKVMQKSLASSQDTNTKTILEFLIGLADSGEECPKGQAQVFVRFIKVIDEAKKKGSSVGNVDFLRSYLVDNAKRRFKACSGDAIKKLKQTRHKADVEPFMENIDAQFKRALSQSSGQTSEEEMYEKLKKYHPATDQTDVSWLWFYSSEFAGKSSSESIKNMFVKTCEKFWVTFRPALDLLNVARILNPDYDFFKNDIELLALNERNRVCNEIYNNPKAFVSQLSTKQKWYHNAAGKLVSKRDN